MKIILTPFHKNGLNGIEGYLSGKKKRGNL